MTRPIHALVATLLLASTALSPARTHTDSNTGWNLNDNKPVDLQGQQASAQVPAKP